MPSPDAKLARRLRTRHRRRVGLAGVCLALTGFIGMTWARSTYRQDLIRWRQPRDAGYREVAVRSEDGVMAIEASDWWAGSQGGPMDRVEGVGCHWYSFPANRPTWYRSYTHVWYGLPVGYSHHLIEASLNGFFAGDVPRVPPVGTATAVWVPYGALLAPAALGSYVTVRLAWRRRPRPGRCRRCGYDLRGSPGRCPECGTAA